MAIHERLSWAVLAGTGGQYAAFGKSGARRDALFRESFWAAARRWLYGAVYALMPQRIASLPQLLWHSAVDILRGGTPVPDPARTRATPNTFGGVCRDPSAETVLAAARLGFFPWCHFGPLKWWTRKERMVLFFDEHHMSKRLRRDMRKAAYRVTFDEAFDDVIAACAGRRSYNRHSLTWITPQIMRLYAELFDLGHAHSFEVWNEAGELVGGGYGLSVGRVFITESQFSREPNTSKIGFAVLNYHLAKWGYVLNDGKDFTPTIEAMGFRLIPRAEFEAILREHANIGIGPGTFISRAEFEVVQKWHASTAGRPGRWAVEAKLAEVAGWEPKGAPPKEDQIGAAPRKTSGHGAGREAAPPRDPTEPPRPGAGPAVLQRC
jgi:leucyl/phenylalanyl-tRNA--protein transferase